MEAFSSEKRIPSSLFFLYKFHQGKSGKNFFKSKLILCSFANNHIPLQGGPSSWVGWKCQWQPESSQHGPWVVGPETTPSIILTYGHVQIKVVADLGKSHRVLDGRTLREIWFIDFPERKNLFWNLEGVLTNSMNTTALEVSPKPSKNKQRKILGNILENEWPAHTLRIFLP